MPLILITLNDLEDNFRFSKPKSRSRRLVVNCSLLYSFTKIHNFLSVVLFAEESRHSHEEGRLHYSRGGEIWASTVHLSCQPEASADTEATRRGRTTTPPPDCTRDEWAVDGDGGRGVTSRVTGHNLLMRHNNPSVGRVHPTMRYRGVHRGRVFLSVL